MTTAYQTLTDFKGRSIMPPGEIDALVRHRFSKDRPDVVATLQGGPSISAASGTNTYTRTVGSWIADGFQVGQQINVAGFANGGNNGPKTITAINVLSITVSSALVNEGPVLGVSVTGPSPVTPETRFADVVVTGSIVSVILTAAALLAATGVTNYATIIVSKRTAGGAPVVIAQLDTTVTTLPAGATVTADDVLTVQITKTGAGATMPALTIDVKPTPNFVELALQRNTAHIEARLRKRYAVPFAAPVPEAVNRWLAFLTTRDCYMRRGSNPTSVQDEKAIFGMAETADAEIKEAADSKDGLFELPLRDDLPQQGGVQFAAPLGYSETSPYVSTDIQVQTGVDEDSAGTGTGP